MGSPSQKTKKICLKPQPKAYHRQKGIPCAISEFSLTLHGPALGYCTVCRQPSFLPAHKQPKPQILRLSRGQTLRLSSQRWSNRFHYTPARSMAVCLLVKWIYIQSRPSQASRSNLHVHLSHREGLGFFILILPGFLTQDCSGRKPLSFIIIITHK